jgi:polyisoprenoid-binding protein YceI
LSWSATKVGGGHNGAVTIKNGTFTVKKNTITEGSAVVDMNGIVSLDLSGETKSGLEKHLKSADFFDVEKFPEATFMIKRVHLINKKTDMYQIKGDATIKGKTMPLTVRATITEKDGVISVISKDVSINRTKYGITYGSDIIGTLKDKLISNLFKVKINLVANKNK